MFSFNRIDIATPEEYQKLLDGFYNKYPFICVESGAHDDVLGEAKRWADSKIHQQLRFIDEDNNMIVVNPRTKSVTGNFKRGKLFNNLPNDYKSYTIVVQHDAVITREDQSVMGEWPFYADVLVSHLSDWVAWVEMTSGLNDLLNDICLIQS